MRRVTAAAGAAVGAALLLAGCGGPALKADDPSGYQACQRYAEVAEITDDPIGRMGGAIEVGKLASRASTPEIRDAAEPVAGSWIVDGDALTAACEANGVEVG